MRALVKTALSVVAVASAAACSLASGWSPKDHPPRVIASADPDTQPLPPGSSWTIPDPKAPPPPAATAEAVSAADAGAEDAAAQVAEHTDHDAGAAHAKVPAKKPATAPAAAATPPAADCGSGGNPCPMQAFMRGQMASAKTPEALAAAFTRVSRMSPNGGWSWASIAKKGADLAKAGDVKGAKAQCAACHSAYKAPYKAQYRAKKI